MQYPKEAIKERGVHEDGMSFTSYYPFSFCYCRYAKIYTLTDFFGNVFYVGCTTQDLKTRLSCHIARFTNPKKWSNQKKINKIIELDFKVNINLIEQKFLSDQKPIYIQHKMRERELYWIKYYMNLGFDLCNREAA